MSVIAIMDRFKCMASDVYDEDTGLLRLIEIEALVLEADPDYYTRQAGGGEP
ncbi:MAG: hypothetical protein ABW046_22490 [Actinoplanes sp.]